MTKKVAMIGVGKLGQDCAEVMSQHYDVVGYDVKPRNPAFTMLPTIEQAVKDRDLIFIAAPTSHDPKYGGETPTSHLPNKDFDYTIVTEILKEVNKYVNQNQLVVLISTVLPGTVRNQLRPCITNARFIYNPYLIAMGTIKWDMVNPEMVIIGTEDGSLTGDAQELIDFYKVFMENNPRYEVGSWDEAESIKIFYNTFISTKLALVNMIQDVAETNGNINVDVVTNALARSTHRIMGPAYMKAGLGDGGACHPRDNIALRYLADRLNLGYDLFDAIMTAREKQAERMAFKCLENGKNVTIIGKAYKPGVHYTNGSASMLVGHYIEKHGGNVNYYDPNTGDHDFKIDWTEVYLIGYWDDFVEKIMFPPHAIIIDPWRKIEYEQNPSGCIIHYGDTRKKKIGKPDENYMSGPNYTTFCAMPRMQQYIDKIYLIFACTDERYTVTRRSVPDIIEEIKTQQKLGKTKFIFHNGAEALLTFQLRRCQQVIERIDIPANNFFFHCSGFNAEEAYENFCKKYNYTKRMNILISNHFEYVSRDYSKYLYSKVIPQYDIKLKEKKFVCFNKIHRPHRIRLVVEMIKNGLINQSFYSFYGGWEDWIERLLEYNVFGDEVSRVLTENKHLFPIKCNITEERHNPVDLLPDDLYYHDNSYFSVITETFFYLRHEPDYSQGLLNSQDDIFLSEKIFRAVAFKHPFILLCTPNTLKYFRNLGFKTFHPFIDESYDDIQDGNERLAAIVKEIERLCRFTDTEWIEWQQNIKSIVEHNFDVFLNRTDYQYNLDKIEHLFRD